MSRAAVTAALMALAQDVTTDSHRAALRGVARRLMHEGPTAELRTIARLRFAELEEEE